MFPCRPSEPVIRRQIAPAPSATIPTSSALPSPHHPALPQVAYQAIDKLLADPASALKGSLFWQFYDAGQIAPASEGGGRGLFGEATGQGATATMGACSCRCSCK